MKMVKLALLLGMFVGTIAYPTPQQAEPNNTQASQASGLKPSEISLCPLPIPNCIPEHYFDPKTCRCRPRP
jgi:CXCXC repeat